MMIDSEERKRRNIEYRVTPSQTVIALSQAIITSRLFIPQDIRARSSLLSMLIVVLFIATN